MIGGADARIANRYQRRKFEQNDVPSWRELYMWQMT